MKKNLLNSLRIENYKIFKELQIPILDRVNLIWGNNNVGKSSLLEAISILSSYGNIDQIYEILQLRDEDISAFKRDDSVSVSQEISAFLPMMPDYSLDTFSKNGFKIGDKDETFLQIHLVNRCRFPMKESKRNSLDNTVIQTKPFNEPISDSVIDYTPAIGVKLNDIYVKYLEFIVGGIARSRVTSRDSNYIPCEYIASKYYKLRNIETLWSNISMTEYEKFVIQALQIIDPKVRRFNVLSDSVSEYRSDYIPYVLIDGNPLKLRLSAMGDGMNRVLMIVLAMLNCKDGIFLLDEFENGLHYSVQEKLWEIIFQLSEMLNIQVFVTTHSNDCIKSYSKIADRQKDGIAIRLDRVKDAVKCQIYDNMKDLLFATQSGIELR